MNKSEFEKADLREKHIQNFLKNSVYSLIITHTKLWEPKNRKQPVDDDC